MILKPLNLDINPVYSALFELDIDNDDARECCKSISINGNTIDISFNDHVLLDINSLKNLFSKEFHIKQHDKEGTVFRKIKVNSKSDPIISYDMSYENSDLASINLKIEAKIEFISTTYKQSKKFGLL
jgi:hypothetical protein